MLQVRADNQLLDTQPQQEISLTFDNSFFEVEHIPVSVSTPIAFPLTPQICRLFQFVPTMLMEPGVRKVPAELLMDGIVICSGVLVFDEFSEDMLNYTFVGAEFDDAVSGNLTGIKFPAYENTSYQALVNDGRSGACPEFRLPQIMRENYAAQSEYRTSTDSKKVPECSATDKYANWLGTTTPFVVPAIRVTAILESILPDVNIVGYDLNRLLDNLAILGLYKSASTHNRFGVIPVDYPNRASDTTPPTRCTLDLADAMPDMSCAEFVANLLKMTCSTLFCDGRYYRIQSNKELLESSEVVDWTGKVADVYSCTLEEGQGYSLSFQNPEDTYSQANHDDPDQEDEISVDEVYSMMDVLAKIKASQDLVSIKHVPTGDIISGWAEQAYLYYYQRTANKWNETKTTVPLSDIAHQAGFAKKEGSESQNYDCSITFRVPRCVPTEIYHLSSVLGGEATQVVGLCSMTPVVEFPPIGGTRPETVYIGLLLDNNFVDKGIYFTRPEIWVNPGAETRTDLSLAIEGDNGLYEKFHKTFAEWLRKPQSTRKVGLNLSAADIANLKLYRKHLIANQTWFIKSLEVVLNTSSDAVSATAEIMRV